VPNQQAIATLLRADLTATMMLRRILALSAKCGAAHDHPH